jgi:hypothetical protein
MSARRSISTALVLALMALSGGAAAQQPAAPSAALGELVFLGEAFGVEAAQLTAALQRRLPAVQQCYARALNDSPTLAGEMQLDVTFGRNGRATAVTATGLGSVPAVSQCVAGVVRAVAFPRLRPREAQTVRFLVPVNFRRS